MKNTYPIVISSDETGYVVHVPDFDIDAHGSDIAEAVFMARVAIRDSGSRMKNDGGLIPEPSSFHSVEHGEAEMVSLIEVDFDWRRGSESGGKIRESAGVRGVMAVQERKTETGNLNFSAAVK